MYAEPARATGSGVTVAVLDTGVTTHHDLAADLVPGHDFVSRPADARDGCDPDATDPGRLGGARRLRSARHPSVRRKRPRRC
ncbi:hypothetical protein [Micromonospora halophytica]|uniref:Subtilase family protein n=1 Tax=Micromonospora halophytica TaxID=47864 RepID=A0A1C5JER4_9ACTN|nr:hypothetical protein [Micromonospora halophytica]SCG69013.1 hypothetical protein GA0070560_12933 [Micromonospora halophytica]